MDDLFQSRWRIVKIAVDFELLKFHNYAFIYENLPLHNLKAFYTLLYFIIF